MTVPGPPYNTSYTYLYPGPAPVPLSYGWIVRRRAEGEGSTYYVVPSARYGSKEAWVSNQMYATRLTESAARIIAYENGGTPVRLKKREK